MSLMGTLAKVAIGVVIAKSVGGMLKGGGGLGGSLGGSLGGGSVGSDGRYGGPMSPGRHKTGLEDMMGDIFKGTPGGAAPAPQQQDPFGQESGPVAAPEPKGGGLGDLLENLGRSGGGTGARKGGGLDDVLGQLGKGGGGLGDLLGGILGGAVAGRATKGFGDVLNDALARGGEPATPPSQSQEAAAALMLRAMIQAAKSDGRIDAAEQKRLTDNLGEATPDEIAFVRNEVAAPIDIEGLCGQVPDGLQQQVYAMSLSAIDLDSQVEARYLALLARGLGLRQADVDNIHSQMGAASLTI